MLLLGDEVGLVLGEPSSDGPGLLVTEVERKVCRVREKSLRGQSGQMEISAK